MRKRTSLPIVALALVLCACAPAETGPAIDMAAETEAVKATSMSWLEYARAKDAAGIASLFTKDGTLYQLHVEPLVGPAAIEAFMVKGFEDEPDLVPNFGTDRVLVAASGDLAVEFGSWGPEAGDFGNYITVYQKVDGTWKVIGDMALSTNPEAAAPAM